MVKIIIWRPVITTDHDTDQAKIVYKKIVELKHRLVFVVSGEMSRQELMDKLNLKHKANFRANYLKPAQNEGLIEMINPDKPTIESQKYRLTEKGEKLKLNLENTTVP